MSRQQAITRKGLFDLHRRKALYAAAEGDAEALLFHAERAAFTAWEANLGVECSLWCDMELESALSDLGRRLYRPGVFRAGRRLAFVASTLYDMGGHSETLYNWSELLVQRFPEQRILLTGGSNQEHHFPSLAERFLSRGTDIVAMPHHLPRLHRTSELLARLSEDGYSCVFAFIHPFDAIAVAALCGVSDRLPVVFFNHADISFWLGATCFRHYVDYRDIGASLSLHARGVRKTRVIPLTTTLSVVEARRSTLGIPEDATVSLSLGSLWKTTCDPAYSYFRAVGRLLERHPGHHHVFLTTPPGREELELLLPLERNTASRFHVIGPFADVAPFYSIADFVIETFPLVGGNVRVESMAAGLPLVAFENVEQPLYSRIASLGEDYPLVAHDEDEVVELSSILVTDGQLRLRYGRLLADRFRREYSAERIKEMLMGMVEEVCA